MTTEISNFIPGSLAESDKYIEFARGHFVIEKQTGEVQMNLCDVNGKSLIATLYNILFAPDLCECLFNVVELMNSGHT